MKYILAEMGNDAVSQVWKAVEAQGALMGFCVADREFGKFIWNPEKTTAMPIVSSKNADSSM